MTRRNFLFAAGGIIIFSLTIRLWPLLSDNFYFTVDQGRDAVLVRDILVRHRFTLIGPQQTFAGVYTGPLWYYFLAPGYLSTGGDPRGAAMMMVTLNLGLLSLIIWWLRQRLESRSALLVGLGLSIFWYFFETSAWAFNPFPTVALGFGLLYLLEQYLAGKGRAIIWAVIVVFLTFNVSIPTAVVFWLSSFIIGLWGVRKRQISLSLFLFLFLVPLVFILILNGRSLARDFVHSFSAGPQSTGYGTFKSTNFTSIGGEFLQIIGRVGSPQSPTTGLVLVLSALYLGRVSSRGPFIRRQVNLFLLLLAISFIFFGLSRGWRDWQTLYLAPILLMNLILILSQKSQVLLARLILILIFILQFQYAFSRYLYYPADKNDPSILANRYKAIDWIYNRAGSQGFGVYTYTKSYFDYPQQYLFWWYGRNKYGYLPCEYANLPTATKFDYIPQALDFSLPKKDCGDLRFLIIESETNGEKNKDWIKSYQAVTKLDEAVNLGGVRIEKRELTQDADMLFDTNVYLQSYWDGPLHLMIPNSWPIDHSGNLTVAKYSDDFWLKAWKLKKNCLGQNYPSSSTNVSVVVFRGKVNDYLVEVHREGEFTNANHLAERILQAVTIAEDPNTQPVKSCLLQ